MRAFKRIVITDLRNVRNYMAITAAIFIAAHFVFLALTNFVNGEAEDVWFTLINSLEIGASIIMPIILSFTIWSEEWKLHTHYMLFSLPVPRWHILLSKLITVIIALFLFSAVSLLCYGAEISLNGNLPEILGNGHNFHILVLLLDLLSYLFVICLAMFSYLLGKAVPKLRGLVVFIVFVVLINAPSLIVYGLTGNTDEGANSLNLSAGMFIVDGHIQLPYITALIDGLFILLFFCLSGLLLKRRIEL